MLLVCQVEASSISHVHLEASRGEALRLLLVDASDLLLRVTDRPIVLL